MDRDFLKFDVNRYILPQLLENVPEIQEAFEELCKEFIDTEEELIQYQQESEASGYPPPIPHTPGIYTIADLLLCPLINEMATEYPDKTRIQEVMTWIESLASSSNFAISNFVSVGICENMITTYEYSIRYTYPFMGPTTRQSCIYQFERFRVMQSTLDLFLNN